MINGDSLLKIFKALSVPTVILLPDAPEFTVAEVSDSFLKETKKCAEQVVGKSIFTNFPAPEIVNSAYLKSSLQKVFDTGLPVKQVIENVELSETFPILSASGEIEYIVHSFLNDTSSNVFCVDKKCMDEKNQLKSSEEK